MKLLNCYVSAFGKLKDFSYEFSDGLNTVKQENGWGKSTFATFIKAMFYGLDDAKRTLEGNERKLFAPWNSTGKFGGSLTFEWGGKPYKIERFFGAKSSEDEIKLYDLSTGKAFTEGASVENIGERIFSIDKDGFLSTTYFSQKDFEIKSNASITAKYNSSQEMGDSSEYVKAVNLLDDKIKELKSRGDKGKINDLKRVIVATEDEIERTKQAVSTVETLKKDLSLLNNETETLSANIKVLTDKLNEASKREAGLERKKRFDAVQSEIKFYCEQRDAANSVLKNKNISLEKIADAEKCIRNYNDVLAKEKTTNSLIEEYSEVTGKTEKGKSSFYPYNIAAIVFAIVFIVGVAVGFFAFYAGLLVALSGLIGVAVVLALSFNVKNTKGDSSSDKIKEIYERKKRDAEEYALTRKQFYSALTEFFGEYNFTDAETSFESRLDKLKDAIKKREEAECSLMKLRAEENEISALGISEKAPEGESVFELNQKLKVATDWYKNRISEAEKIKTRVNTLEAAMENILDLENKKSRLKEELFESEKSLDILVKTSEYLKKADETLKIKYRAPLQTSLNKYVKYIAGNISVEIDTDMNVSVSETGASRGAEYFSKGYRNLFEICKRFALTDILFKGEKPFIILDDPFYNLDDEKVTASVSLIKELSSEYQILYLICHESRRA